MKSTGIAIEPLARCAVALLLGAAVSAQMPAPTGRRHELPLTPANVHWGYYDARIPPVLTVDSGDRVRVETMVARGLARLKLAGVRDAEIPESMKAVERAIADKSAGPHPMTGPIYVNGAEPGDSITVTILDLDFLHPFGVGGFSPGGGVLPEDFPYAALRLVRWPRGADRVEFAPGIRLALKPFWGSIGVAPPPLSGRLSSGPPGWHGGNLDNRDLGVGATLELPVHVAGALLSIGDGHAMQGDGEVTGTALETSLRGTVEIGLRRHTHLRWPRAETPTDYITMGLDPDLDQATKLATREMVAFLESEKHLSADDAYVLCSLAGNLHVTQAVDGVKGVHMTLPKAVFGR